MSALNDTVALYKQVKTEWSSSKPNLSKCGKLLAELKVTLTLFLTCKYNINDLFVLIVGAYKSYVSSNF